MQLRVGLAFILFTSLLACRDDGGLGVDYCTREGAGWKVSPSPIEVNVGSTVEVLVTEVWCSGYRNRPVYPPLLIADAAVARANSTYRTIEGLKVGTTLLTLHDETGLVGLPWPGVEVIVREQASER